MSDAERTIAWERQRLTSKIEELGNEGIRAERRVGEQREKAKAAMDSAAAELANAGPARVANSDALALAAYLQALGLNIDADRINKLLALLAVLAIECGCGFSLAVGMSLSTTTAHSVEEPVSTEAVATGHLCAPVRPRDQRALAQHQIRPITAPIVSAATLGTPVQSDAGVQLLGLLKRSGGVLVCGQRSIGAALGWSKSWTNVVLHELARAGCVSLSTGSTGAVVRLLVGCGAGSLQTAA